MRRLGRRVERPPAHWWILAFYVSVLLLLLFAHGLSARTTGPSGTHERGVAGAPLEGERSLLAADDGRLVSAQQGSGRRIALTFDDGPDPVWTRRIASVLRRLGVPATFFPLGSRVARHPDVVEELSAAGFELGNHTFSHAELSALPGWQRSLEISLTESVLAGAAGIRPRLVRPPYSATPRSVTAERARTLLAIAEQGYVIALSDLDSEDWRRPGVGAIVENATPRAGRGGIVLLHDGGGDRSQTIRALELLVPRLKRRGYRFVRASELLGLAPTQAELPASGAQRLRGRLLTGALQVARVVTQWLTLLLVPIAVVALARALALVGLSRHHVRSVGPRAGPPFTPPVSIVVPAYNEAVGIEQTVRSLAASKYPDFEVIVVDDGSEDGTGDLVERLGLPSVRVIRQANAGKPAALATGVVAARHDLIVTLDGDTVFEKSTLRRVVDPLRDSAVGAVSGNTKVANRGGLLGRWQHIEYVMGFNLDRRLYDVLQCMPTVPGAIGAFRRAALADAGGFSNATLAEDTDITLGIGRAGWRVVYAQEARGWTEAPATLSALWRQRYRWCYGTLQAVWKHRAALWRRGEERIGRRGIPYLLCFQLLLPLLAPLIDVFALYGLFFIDPLAVGGYWLAFNLVLLTLAFYAFHLDGESPSVLWAMPLQQFVYRQLMYLVVVQSVLSAFLGLRLRWQHIERRGAAEVAP